MILLCIQHTSYFLFLLYDTNYKTDKIPTNCLQPSLATSFMIKFRLHLTLATYCNLLGLHLILQKRCSAELLAQNQCRLYLPQSISSQGGHWLRVPSAQGAIGPWLLVPMAQGAIGPWLLGPFAIVGGVRRDIASPLFIRPSAGSTGSPASAPCARARAVKARHPPRPRRRGLNTRRASGFFSRPWGSPERCCRWIKTAA